MADLDITKSSNVVSLTGSDSTGLETNMVSSSANGELDTSDICDNGGVNGALTVGITAIEAKVGSSPLVNRKMLTVFYNGNKDLYWGLSSGLTIANGTRIYSNQLVTFDVGPNTHIWLISNTASQDTRIAEMA